MDSQEALSALGWRPFFKEQLAPEEPDDFLTARVIAVHKHAFILSDGLNSFPAIMSGKGLHESSDASDLPVTGDWVLARMSPEGTAVIVRRLERYSELSRRRPLDRSSLKTSFVRQVLAANLDYVFLVMSLNRDLNHSRLQRALTMIWNSGATPVVLLSKCDLCSNPEAMRFEAESVARGADIHCFSCLENLGLDAILKYFKPGVTGCLIGSSGAGKTTLINSLCGTNNKTMAVREDDDRGRHATTTRTLFMLPGGGMLIDTPGLREIGLMEDCDLADAFREFSELAPACRFSDCTHTVEPGCAVIAAVSEGAVPENRYNSYVKLSRELEHETNKSSVLGSQEAKRKEKQLARLIKGYNRNHRK